MTGKKMYERYASESDTTRVLLSAPDWDCLIEEALPQEIRKSPSSLTVCLPDGAKDPEKEREFKKLAAYECGNMLKEMKNTYESVMKTWGKTLQEGFCWFMRGAWGGIGVFIGVEYPEYIGPAVIAGLIVGESVSYVLKNDDIKKKIGSLEQLIGNIRVCYRNSDA